MKNLMVASLSLTVLLAGCGPMNNEGVGTLTGGVVGGLLGSQFGGGSGKVAAAAGGALLGAFLGGQIGKSMDRQDRMEMQMALETSPTGTAKRWVNPNNGNQYVVTTRRTYYTHQMPCREYVTQATIGGRTEKIYGTACRQGDGSWQIRN